MDLNNTLTQTFNQAAQETQRFLMNFNAFQSKINLEDLTSSSEELKNEVQSLWNQFQKISHQNSSGSSDPISLSSISQSSQVIHQKLQDLAEKVNEMQASFKKIQRDAEINEVVQILDVIKKDDRWVIKVRSDPKCKKVFRNVDIWDIGQKVSVAQFKLIEPKVVLKREIAELILAQSYYVARIGDRIVSKPYFIYTIKISYDDSDESNGYKFILKNLFDEDLSNLVVHFKSDFYQVIDSIPGNGEIGLCFPDINGYFNISVLQDQRVISNLYENTIE